MFEGLSDYVQSLMQYGQSTPPAPVTSNDLMAGVTPALNWGPSPALDGASMISGAGLNPTGMGVRSPSFWQGLTGYTDPDGMRVNGWGNLAIGAAQGLAGAFMGMQQYGLAQDALKESKRQFNLNYDAQRQMTNSQLEDRQRARVASNAGAYQSPTDYMNKYGVK